ITRPPLPRSRPVAAAALAPGLSLQTQPSPWPKMPAPGPAPVTPARPSTGGQQSRSSPPCRGVTPGTEPPLLLALFFQVMAGRRREVQAVHVFQLLDPAQRFATEGTFALKGMQDNALNQIAEGNIMVFRHGFEDFEQPLLHAQPGLGALDDDRRSRMVW